MKIWITRTDKYRGTDVNLIRMAFSTREKLVDRLMHLRPGDIIRWDNDKDCVVNVDLKGFDVEVYDSGDDDYIMAGVFYDNLEVITVHADLIEVDG